MLLLGPSRYRMCKGWTLVRRENGDARIEDRRRFLREARFVEYSDDHDINRALNRMRKVCGYIRRCFQMITAVIVVGLMIVVAAVLFGSGAPLFGDVVAALYMGVVAVSLSRCFGICLNFLTMWSVGTPLFLKIRLTV